MSSQAGRLKGGIACGVLNKAAALQRYYRNPNRCLWCKLIIRVPDGISKVGATRRKKFCNRSCAASFNNSGHPKRVTVPRKCRVCGAQANGKFATMCKGCRPNWTRRIGNMTIKELNEKCRNKFSVRNIIRAHAQRVYRQSDLPKFCAVCSYSRHIEVAHRKAIKEFSETSLVKLINDLLNLVALCPTHHWEFDNGFVTLGLSSNGTGSTATNGEIGVRALVGPPT